ncbi:MAG: carboxypeptidase-like regulatory domain-containing protein [Acidobacteriota bacterium]
MRIKFTLLLAIPVFFSLPALVCGQSNIGDVRGILADPNGAVLPGATITARRKEAIEGEKTRSAFTNTNGEFQFLDLPFGVYTLEYTFPGFETGFKMQVTLTSARPSASSITFSLQPCGDVDPTESSAVTDDDKGDIARQILARQILKKPPNKKLTVSTENLKSEWMSVYREKIVLLPQNQIQWLGETKELPYLKFSEMKIKGSCVQAGISELTALPRDQFLVDYTATTYEFRKIGGQWIGKTLIGIDF